MTVITYRHLEVLIRLLSCCTAELVGVAFPVNLKPAQCSGELRPLKDIFSVCKQLMYQWKNGVSICMIILLI